MEAPAASLRCANHFHSAGAAEALHVCPVDPDRPDARRPLTQRTSVIGRRFGRDENALLVVRRQLHAHKNKK